MGDKEAKADSESSDGQSGKPMEDNPKPEPKKEAEPKKEEKKDKPKKEKKPKKPKKPKKTNEEKAREKFETALDSISKLFTPGEKMLHAAMQRKLISVYPHTVVATNKRLIKYLPKLFGARFEDHSWSDLKDLEIREQTRSASLRMRFNKKRFYVDDLSKEDAKKIYSLAQYQKQLRSGAAPQKAELPSFKEEKPAGDDKLHERLLKAKKLFDNGLISKEEFNAKKKEILKQL